MIRNFSIIAHIDHGKSTLSDRFIQICGGLSEREMSTQVLDSMDLEKERGITIKAQSVTVNYKSLDKKNYQLNFIDTPGHVDFSYEVSRSLAACEGALLIVDAGQGVEAQTLANFHMAMEMNLTIIAILNKTDLPFADPDRVSQEIEDIIGINSLNILRCSAKTGFGVLEILENIICNIPPPDGNNEEPLQALIIDSWFDKYLGVVSLIRIKHGILRRGDKVKVMSTGCSYCADHLGVFTPKRVERDVLKCGEIGWLICAIKNIHGAPVGDTLTLTYKPADQSLSGFKNIKPQVYADLFPIKSDNYGILHEALGKLSLNDSALFYESENSSILGLGFRCGFLGLLHMDIIKERLEREYNLELIATAPTVIYEVLTLNSKILYIDNPAKLPSFNNIVELREPIAECRILLPQKYLGDVINLCIRKRGIQIDIVYYGAQVMLLYEIPLAEIIFDFFNILKSISNGYASLNYEFKYFKKSNLVRVDLLINRERIDALIMIIHQNNVMYRSRKLVEKLQKLIPRQQFDIAIQAAIGNRIIARSNIKQLRKNVLTKCHGGDITRKKKLLQKQKEGKKRMKQIGNVKLSQEVFLAIMHVT